MGGIIAFLLKLGFGGIVDKAISHLEKKAELENDRERLKSQTTIELAKQAVIAHQANLAFNQAKFQFPWFWIMAAMFVGPLAFWWSAVILDSVFMFSWNVADLPTPQMQEWAGAMIRWLFYSGTVVGGVKAVMK